MNVYNINLNLLKAFDALMQTRNVSRAAEKLSITQPSMSNLLAQLRELFSDEILIRRKKEMIATQKALEISPKIREALEILEQTFTASEKFNPATSNRVFTIATNDYIQYVLISRLIEKLEKIAPFVSIKIISTENICHKELYETGRVDIGIGVIRNLDTRLQFENLFTDDSVCVARKKHPVFSETNKFTLKEYLSCKHIFMRSLPSNEISLTEQALNKLGTSRQMKVENMQILPGLRTIQCTNLIGMVPRLIAEMAKGVFNLQVVNSPLKIPPISISMVWHNMHESNWGHQWFRSLINEVVALIV